MSKLRNLLLLLIVCGIFLGCGLLLYAHVGNFAKNFIYVVGVAAMVGVLLVNFAFRVKDTVKELPFDGLKSRRVQQVAHHITVRLWTIAGFMAISVTAAAITSIACASSATVATMWFTVATFALVCTSSFYGLLVPARLFFELKNFEIQLEEYQRRHSLLERLSH